MTERQMKIGWLLIVLVMLAGCSGEADDDELSGRVTLWHSWSESEAAILGDALAEFQELHPDVRVIPVALPEDHILEEFITAGNDGLGPDVLIGTNSWIGELVNAGLIRPLNPDRDRSNLFDSRNIALTQYEDQIYGTPQFLAPRALYYNKGLAASPPGDLDELLADAAAGNRVAFVPRFEEAYWGIQTFGEGLFDDQGRFTLAESGFTEWLAWLDEAQGSPGVILNVDDRSLLELFATGEIAYYVAGPGKLDDIDALLDEEDPLAYGVVPLPSGPNGPAGPLLPAETILLYAFTSDAQTDVADALASFLVNQQQSIRFMRELDRVPANPAIAVDPRIYPIVNGFTRQADTAVVIPNEVPTDPLAAAGDRAYVSVLSGVLTPAEAVCQFGREVATFQVFSTIDMSLPEGCELSEFRETIK